MQAQHLAASFHASACSGPCAGGVYIAGGILPRVLKRAQKGVLYDAFINRAGRDRFSAILQQTPLFVVVNTAAGIIGSREVALSLVD